MFFGDMPNSAVAYCRVSSAAQEERETIQNQIDFATNYCKLNNIELTHIYKDDGVTGTLPLDERPAGYEMLQDAKNGKFNLVLVFKLDRLGRATRVILNAVHDLDGYGVKVRSMTEPFDTSDASGRFLLTILAGVADLERSNILQRMGLGANRAAKKGKYMGGLTPYGYTVDSEGYLTPNTALIGDTGMNEVDVVRMIYNLCIDGKSTLQITERLTAMGIPPFCSSRDVGKRTNKNSKWRPTTVYRMIKSTTYKGINRYGKNRDTTIQRTVPPIVSEEVWDKAQEVLSANKVKIKGNVKKNYLLRGLLKCAHCGYSFSGAFTGKYVYYSDIGRYAWRSHRLEKKCIGKTLPQKWVEDTVWESCMTYIRDPQLVVKSAKSRDNSEELEKEIALIRTKIAHNGVENQRLIDLYKAGLISLEAVTGEFEKVKTEKNMLQKQLDQLEYDLRIEKDMHDVSSTISDLEQMQQLLESPTLDFDVKKTVVDTMIEKILVDSIAETITIHFAFGDTVTHKIVFKKKPR